MTKLGLVGWSFLAAAVAFPLKAQESNKVPVDTQLTLDASPPTQRPAIRSVVYIQCRKANSKGTAFVISSGLVVTAAHVLCGCDVADIDARTTADQPVTFSKLVRDEDRDLAVLRPIQTLTGGLELASGADPVLGTRVNTWGFPLIYNGPAPLLSVGYASGYYEAPEQSACASTETGKKAKHIVVNGAFNPGNSGGPLFVFGQDKVIGVVIWKRIAFSSQVQVAIDGFHSGHGASLSGRFQERQPDGTYKGITDEEVIARVLQEFYTKVQVDIGEAVSVSELRKFLNDHASEIGPSNSAP